MCVIENGQLIQLANIKGTELVALQRGSRNLAAAKIRRSLNSPLCDE